LACQARLCKFSSPADGHSGRSADRLDGGQRWISQGRVEPRHRGEQAIEQRDTRPEPEPRRGLLDPADVPPGVPEPRGRVLDRERPLGCAAKGVGELVDRGLATGPDLEDFARDRAALGIEGRDDPRGQVVDVDEVIAGRRRRL
jgi:hypothetical protein